MTDSLNRDESRDRRREEALARRGGDALDQLAHREAVECPDAEVIAHPECHDGILRHAAHIASTSGLIDYAKTSPKQTFIVATEAGILHKMQQAAPGKTLIAAPPEDESCSCNTCPFMKKNTLEKLYLALRDLKPQVDVAEPVRVKALRPIQRMLEMS